MFKSQAMGDSGIEMDISQLLATDEDFLSDQSKYYELKSSVVVGSPVTEIKNASMPMRANLKQQLQRQQLYDQEKRQKSPRNGHLTGSIGINVPHIVESSSVPSNVLQVRTQLQHPTKYHVRQNQKRQVQNFLQEQHDGSSLLPIQSLPSNLHPASSAANLSQQQQHHHTYIQSSTSAPDPDISSPLIDGSMGGAEFIPTNFDLLGDLTSVEHLELGSILTDSDLIEIQPSLGTEGLNQNGLVSSYDGLDTDGSVPQTAVSSCPTRDYHSQSAGDLGHTGIMSVQDEMWRKERIKKDNHNMIERRRRFNINDRIKELGGLLPKTMDPDSRQNKGSILKASVDYIRILQDEQRKLRGMMDEKKKAELDLRKVLIRLNQMNLVMKSHGIESGGMDDLELASHVANNPANFLTSPLTLTPTSLGTPVTHHTPITSSHGSHTFLSSAMTAITVDDLMDESSPVSGDPMLMSAPVSPEPEDVGFHFDFRTEMLHK